MPESEAPADISPLSNFPSNEALVVPDDRSRGGACYIACPSYLMACLRHPDSGQDPMMGVPSLAKGTINAASIMVFSIVVSIFIWGRGFCGWVCDMRGAIELADWILRKLKCRQYLNLREKNVSSTRPIDGSEDRCSLRASAAGHHSDSQCRILSQGHVMASSPLADNPATQQGLREDRLHQF